MKHLAPKHLLDELDAEQIEYTVLPHRRTMSAVAEARALDVSPGEVAKTVVLTTPAGFVRAALPASERLDLRKVRDLLDTKDVAFATEEELAGAYPDYELGAVPPLARQGGDRVIVDQRLTANDTVLVEAGTHEASLRLRAADLTALSSASVGDICVD
jgi:Ala-tRNA(Pro) deacylase